MSFWQIVMGVAQIYASKRSARQLSTMRNNQFAGGSTVGSKVDTYGRLISQASQVANTTKDQIPKENAVDSGTSQPEMVDSSQIPQEKEWWRY